MLGSVLFTRPRPLVIFASASICAIGIPAALDIFVLAASALLASVLSPAGAPPVVAAAGAAAVTGQIGAMVAISDASGGLLTGGAIAYWDTTNTRWSYIQTGTAV